MIDLERESGGNGLFETMKAPVVKKNFQSHDQ